MLTSKIIFRQEFCIFCDVKPQIFSARAFGARVKCFLRIERRPQRYALVIASQCKVLKIITCRCTFRLKYCGFSWNFAYLSRQKFPNFLRSRLRRSREPFPFRVETNSQKICLRMGYDVRFRKCSLLAHTVRQKICTFTYNLYLLRVSYFFSSGELFLYVWRRFRPLGEGKFALGEGKSPSPRPTPCCSS